MANKNAADVASTLTALDKSFEETFNAILEILDKRATTLHAAHAFAPGIGEVGILQVQEAITIVLRLILIAARSDKPTAMYLIDEIINLIVKLKT